MNTESKLSKVGTNSSEDGGQQVFSGRGIDIQRSQIIVRPGCDGSAGGERRGDGSGGVGELVTAGGTDLVEREPRVAAC